MTSSNGTAHNASAAITLPRIWTAAELVATEFGAQEWAVPGLVPVGLTLFVGSPKLGKSWMALSLMLAIATGGVFLGQIPVQQGEVLYLALEDRGQRLKSRLQKLTQDWRVPMPAGAHLSTEWPRMGKGGLRALAYWLGQHPACRLVIIDTLAKIRNESSNSRNAYEEDDRTASAIKRVADEFGVAILVIHHLRKMAADDIYERVSGSNGLTGAADGVLIIRRDRGKPDAVMFASGRDVNETEMALRFDKETAQWALIGDAETFRLSAARQKIAKALLDADRPMKPAEIAQLLSSPTANVKQLCYDMAREGQIKNAGDGWFTSNPLASNRGAVCIPVTPVTVVTETDITKLTPVTTVTASNRVTTVTGSNRVLQSLDCLSCGQPLPDGWYHRCPACLEAEEMRVDPD